MRFRVGKADTDTDTGAAARLVRPLILIRGFGGPDVEDEQADAYQGFNNGSVYPHRRGENFIYEGFVLRALKSERYRDATNVVGYHHREVNTVPPKADTDAPALSWPEELVTGTVAVDVTMARQVIEKQGVAGTLWVYRYYDLLPRTLDRYGEGLARLIRIIKQSGELAQQPNGSGSGSGSGGKPFAGVDIVAHSMGGLVVRSALRRLKEAGEEPSELIHRIVTLGTPHRGIAFQLLPEWLLNALPKARDAANELVAFDPSSTDFLHIKRWFPVERILTVVGTDYRSYGSGAARLGNRLASIADERTAATNRSDGLVKHSAAQLPGAPRTFVHKCHGGRDSLVTSREAYEIAMRFFHGTDKVQLWLDSAKVTRGGDVFGRSEFWFGVSIKPRYVDFELFHQSPQAENCYGPFDRGDRDEFTSQLPPLEEALSMPLTAPGDPTTGWPRVESPDRRLIWEGWVDRAAKPTTEETDESMVLRLDVYVGERDTLGIGFHDNVVFRKQYYLQVLPGTPPSAVYLHSSEQYLGLTKPKELDALPSGLPDRPVRAVGQPAGGWSFEVGGTGFEGTLRFAVLPESADLAGQVVGVNEG